MGGEIPGWIADTWKLSISAEDYGADAPVRYKYTIVGFGQDGQRLDYVYDSSTNKADLRARRAELRKTIKQHHDCAIGPDIAPDNTGETEADKIGRWDFVRRTQDDGTCYRNRKQRTYPSRHPGGSKDSNNR